VRAPLSLFVLAALTEHPMRPYSVHKRLHERGKQSVVNIRNRNSVQQTMSRLERDGYIRKVPDASGGSGGRFEATESGHEALRSALIETLAAPAKEYPRFDAAVSLVASLNPDEVEGALATRLAAIDAELEALYREIAVARRTLPSVLLLDDDLRCAMLQAEHTWLRQTLIQLRAGSLTWSTEELIQAAEDVGDQHE
jgi:DNA-binding PadR family transcriptional regulator